MSEDLLTRLRGADSKYDIEVRGIESDALRFARVTRVIRKGPRRFKLGLNSLGDSRRNNGVLVFVTHYIVIPFNLIPKDDAAAAGYAKLGDFKQWAYETYTSVNDMDDFVIVCFKYHGEIPHKGWRSSAS